MSIAQTIQNFKPDLKASSLATYLQSLKRISPNKKLDNIDFLQDTNAVLAKIDHLEFNPQRSIINAVIVALQATGEKGKTIQIYGDKMKLLNAEYFGTLAKNEKTEKQKENWVKHSVLLKIAETMVKNAPGSQRSLIAALYTYQAPTRLDYYDMEIVGKDAKLDDNKNYLKIINRSKKEFIFQEYKTSKTYGKLVIPVNKKLNTVINKYMKLNPDIKYLVSGERNKLTPMSRNSLGKTISKVFATSGKNITLNSIRHIYISENIDIEKTKKQHQMAKTMMHSPAQSLSYAKKE